MDKLWKPFGFLVIMILLCSVMVRVLSGSETLSDYAKANPEIAYATPEKQPEVMTEVQPAEAEKAAEPAADVKATPVDPVPAK